MKAFSCADAVKNDQVTTKMSVLPDFGPPVITMVTPSDVQYTGLKILEALLHDNRNTVAHCGCASLHQI